MWDSGALSIDVEPKLIMPEAENDVCMPSLCFHERVFSSKFGDNISLVGMKCDRILLGDIKISPWKCRYRLGIRVEIVLISITKKVAPSGNQALSTYLFTKEHLLKTLSKRTHIPLLINQFVSLIELKM